MRLLLASLLLSGCCSVTQRSYVEQDKANFDTLAPRILDLVERTRSLDKEQKQDIRDRLTAWERRILKALDESE